MRRILTTLVLMLASAATVSVQSKPTTEKPATPEETASLNLSAYAELLRSDVRAQKVAIITEVMGFTEAEDKAFWPIYREYDAEMAKLGDERVALIEEYANNFEKITDDVADKLASRSMDLQTRRNAAMAKCHERVKTATSPRTALRFLQVEHQLQLVIDLQIAASLPLAPVVK